MLLVKVFAIRLRISWNRWFQTRPYDRVPRPYDEAPDLHDEATRPYDRVPGSHDEATHPSNDVSKPENSPKPPRKIHGLPEIVRALKTFSARRINQHLDSPGVPAWQRNYYEHIIRNERELRAIQEYILANPINWQMDQDNPINRST